MLVLADVLCQEPVIIEPDDRQTYGVKEAAELLRTSSKKVYQMCLAGQLRCVQIRGRVRIPIDEIGRFEAEAPPDGLGPKRPAMNNAVVRHCADYLRLVDGDDTAASGPSPQSAVKRIFSTL